MSIFNEPINANLVDQLKKRQDLMSNSENRTPIELSYLNSNSSWVKLQSSVNIGDGDDKLEAALSNVLLGGTIYNKLIPDPSSPANKKKFLLRTGRRFGVNASQFDEELNDHYRIHEEGPGYESNWSEDDDWLFAYQYLMRKLLNNNNELQMWKLYVK